MTDMIEIAPSREVAVAPPTRWRNRWRIKDTIAGVHNLRNGKHYPAGDLIGDSVWPSKEIAEQRAMEKLAGTLIFPHGREPTADYIEWLGAVPETSQGEL